MNIIENADNIYERIDVIRANDLEPGRKVLEDIKALAFSQNHALYKLATELEDSTTEEILRLLSPSVRRDLNLHVNSKRARIGLLKREHVRWYQWAGFFFGMISAVFLAWSNLAANIPLWIPALIAALLSLCWASAGLAIRASTKAWEDTVRHLEANPDAKAFSTYCEKLEKDWRRHFSVTRTLVLIGMIFSIMFTGLALADFSGNFAKPKNPMGEAQHVTPSDGLRRK